MLLWTAMFVWPLISVAYDKIACDPQPNLCWRKARESFVIIPWYTPGPQWLLLWWWLRGYHEADKLRSATLAFVSYRPDIGSRDGVNNITPLPTPALRPYFCICAPNTMCSSISLVLSFPLFSISLFFPFLHWQQLPSKVCPPNHTDTPAGSTIIIWLILVLPRVRNAFFSFSRINHNVT